MFEQSIGTTPPPKPQADILKPQAPPPVNLPVTEPVDIFAGVKEPPPASDGPATAVPPFGEQAARSGMGKKILLIIGGVVLLAIIGIVVWFTLFQGEEDVVMSTPVEPAAEPVIPPAPESEGAPSAVPPEPITSAPAPAEVVAPSVPAADADADGLTDEEERTLGTNPQSADSDQDGLADRDEVRIYRTDPMNPDTDGDGFQDGAEVRNGYDPAAKGKRLFEVPPVAP